MIFLLSAGSADRMNGFPEQLLRVNGETLLDRTVRLLNGRDFRVVTSGFDFGFGEKQITIQKTDSPLDSLYLAASIFGDQHPTTLLGDVCWSKRYLNDFLNTAQSYFTIPVCDGVIAVRNGPNLVTGRRWDERFGIRIQWWALERERHTPRLKDMKSRLLPVCPGEDDFTEDFDFPEEVFTILPNVERLMREQET